jgi:hypothetical protein
MRDVIDKLTGENGDITHLPGGECLPRVLVFPDDEQALTRR